MWGSPPGVSQPGCVVNGCPLSDADAGPHSTRHAKCGPAPRAATRWLPARACRTAGSCDRAARRVGSSPSSQNFARPVSLGCSSSRGRDDPRQITPRVTDDCRRFSPLHHIGVRYVCTLERTPTPLPRGRKSKPQKGAAGCLMPGWRRPGAKFRRTSRRRKGGRQ